MRCATVSRAPRSALLLAVLLVLTATSMAENATCIYPNGDIADSEHVPCDPNSKTGTTCCPKDYQCLSNGLCNDYRYENYQRVLRGACTDKEFGGFCNKVCTEYWPQGDEAVWYCGNGEYCCSRTNTCCNDNKVRKQFQGEPTIAAIAGKTTPQASDFKIYPIETGFYNPSAATTSRSPTSAPTNTSNSAPSSNSNNTLPIAVGVGVGVGIVVVALLVFLFWCIRRRRRRTAHTMHELPATQHSQPPAATTTATATPTTPHNQSYAYDDKTGGWTSKTQSRWSRPAAWSREAGGSTIHEAGDGSPAVEMQGHVVGGKNVVEMDSPSAWSEREAGRQSRFVEGGLWGQGGHAGHAGHEGHTGHGEYAGHEGHDVYGGHEGHVMHGGHTGHGTEAGTVGTEKDVEGLQRRLKGLSG